MTYLKESIIRKVVHAGRKRISKAGLAEIDAIVDRIIQKCIAQHDGGRKTINAELVLFIYPIRRQS